MHFLKLPKDTNLEKQEEKFLEEVNEFLEATKKNEIVDEFFDVVQAGLSLMQIKGIGKKDIRNAKIRHQDKLLKRKWGLGEYINL
jgi:predicted house-cleaning noncanonical NTP pyrophosphatase (MazG superfamily)